MKGALRTAPHIRDSSAHPSVQRPSMQVLTTALCPPHRYLSSSERETVLNAFQSVDFSEGDLLFREGDPGVSFILIREGEVIAIECL